MSRFWEGIGVFLALPILSRFFAEARCHARGREAITPRWEQGIWVGPVLPSLSHLGTSVANCAWLCARCVSRCVTFRSSQSSPLSVDNVLQVGFRPSKPSAGAFLRQGLAMQKAQGCVKVSSPCSLGLSSKSWHFRVLFHACTISSRYNFGTHAPITALIRGIGSDSTYRSLCQRVLGLS